MTIDSDITRPGITTDAVPQRMEEQGVEFHRLAGAARNHRWWRPIPVGIITLVIWAAAFLLIMVVVGLGAGIFPSVESAMDVLLGDSDEFDLGDPFSFAFGMMTLILLIPALWLATRLIGAKPVGLLSSVIGRLRWGWLARCGLVGIAIYAVAYGGSSLYTVAQGESLTPTFDFPRTVVLLILTVTLVPLQSAAEEYVFRGYLMQAIGSWLRHPAFAILLPVPLFVIGHTYGPLGLTDVAVFAIAAGYLTWRTGGLEAALALHIVGNVSGFALAAVGLVDVNATEVGVPSLLVSLLVTLTFVAVVVRLARQHDVQRRAHSTTSAATVKAAQWGEAESVTRSEKTFEA